MTQVTALRTTDDYRGSGRVCPSSGSNITHVILIDSRENEQHIQFPTPIGFTDYLGEVRKAVPDRRFQISESWETA